MTELPSVRRHPLHPAIEISLDLGVVETPHRIRLFPNADDIGRYLAVVVVGARQIDDKVLLLPVVAHTIDQGTSSYPFAIEGG